MSRDIEQATPVELDELANQAVDDAFLKQSLTELVALSPIDYDRRRGEAAQTLGIRVSTLDAEIKKGRPNAESAGNGEGRTILLSDPEPWPEPVNDIGPVLTSILAAVRRFLIVSESAAVAIALWILHTYSHDAANVSPILAITSPEKRCGKTTLLELLTALVTRSLPAANVTAATIFRSVQAFHPTLLIDEADTFIDGDADELRGILNSGHRRSTAIVLRTVGDAHEVKAFSTWCPKAIAAIGRLPDTLQDRSIAIAMRRRSADEKVEGLRFDRVATQLEPLRRQAARWYQDNRYHLTTAEPDMPDGMDDRAADNWRPLLAIADAAGSGWAKLARQAAAELCDTRDDDDESARTMLLSDIRSIYSDRSVSRLASVELVGALAEMEERPWPEWKQGKPITARQLAKLLRPFGVSPKVLRLVSGLAKGYEIDQFDDAFSRYLPSGSVTRLQPNIGAGFSDSSIGNIESNVTDRKNGNPNAISKVTPVTDGKHGKGERRI